MSSAVAPEETLSPLLLEAALPTLYRTNAFRISGLSVDASERDVSRQSQRLALLHKLGRFQQDGPFPLEPPPDEDVVREAIQRLRDPERRLVDEFFWFWPHELGPAEGDEALTALDRGEVGAAREVWDRQASQQTEAYVSVHNLAVLNHARALDLEQASAGTLSETEAKERDACWKQALAYWRLVLERERFWDRLTERIRVLDDPRLTAGTARRLRASLPLALLFINARLAVQAADQGEMETAARHLVLVRESGFEEETVEEALRRAVAPVAERIKTLAKEAEPEADADPEHADKVTKRLLKQTKPLLLTVDALLPEGHPTRDGLHDEVALRALACQIPYGNATEDWKGSLQLLRSARKVAAGETARTRIQDNIRIVEGNLEWDKTHGRCWFCQEAPPDEAAKAEVQLYGEVTHTPVFEGGQVGTRMQWRTATVEVPRCKACHSTHSERPGTIVMAVVLGLVAGVGGCTAINGTIEAAGHAEGPLPVLGVIAFPVCAALVARFVYRRRENRVRSKREGVEVRPASAKNEFPRVKELLKQGWKLGSKPPEAA